MIVVSGRRGPVFLLATGRMMQLHARARAKERGSGVIALADRSLVSFRRYCKVDEE